MNGIAISPLLIGFRLKVILMLGVIGWKFYLVDILRFRCLAIASYSLPDALYHRFR